MTDDHDDALLLAPAALSAARLVIVDDEPVNVLLLRRLLERAGYANLQSATSGSDGLALCESFRPDLVLLDLMMPPPDGFSVMQRLGAGGGEADGDATAAAEPPPAVLVLTADIAPETRRQALAAGARDFVTKPFDATEVLLRIRNLLETRFLYQALRQQNRVLEERVRARTHALEQSQAEILERLARAAEHRDDDTGLHTQRVAQTAARIAEALKLPSEAIERVRRAAPLHDVGKIGIPDAILLTPGQLSPEQFHLMQSHTMIGTRLLSGGRSDLVTTAERIALTHHERWDGSGYPHGLAGEAIPIEGRIVAVADVFDALTHARPYKSAWTVAEAVAEIARQSGRHFDPCVVDAFLTLPHDTLI